jgi:hypothetical protein
MDRATEILQQGSRTATLRLCKPGGANWNQMELRSGGRKSLLPLAVALINRHRKLQTHVGALLGIERYALGARGVRQHDEAGPLGMNQ